MKKLFLFLCFGCAVNLSIAQEPNTRHSIQDSHHTIKGYIKSGIITDANNVYLGEFKANNGQLDILDKNHSVIGHVLKGSEFQDANRKTIGYLKSNGEGTNVMNITDNNDNPLGYLNIETGAVLDKNHNLIGYEIQTEPMWAVPYYFFFKF